MNRKISANKLMGKKRSERKNTSRGIATGIGDERRFGSRIRLSVKFRESIDSIREKGFVLMLEGGHVAHLTVNETPFPYIPQWIVIFILLLMFAVDLYQNWLESKTAQAPITLHRRKK